MNRCAHTHTMHVLITSYVHMNILLDNSLWLDTFSQCIYIYLRGVIGHGTGPCQQF